MRSVRTPKFLPVLSAVVLAAAVPFAAAAQNLPPSHAGFPVNVTNGGNLNASQPVVADLGLGGAKSIVFGTASGFLHVLSKSGGTWAESPGFPVNVGALIASSPAVGDLTGDGIPEIVVGYGNYAGNGPGGVKAYRRDGTLLWSRVSQDRANGPDGQPDPVYSTPAIGDIDGDGKNEVVWGSFDFQIYVVDGATGADKLHWPRTWDQVRDTVWSSPVLHDIDGDGKLDIIIGVDAHLEGPPFNTPAGGCLHVFRYDDTEVPGFPKCVDQVIVSSPVVGDIDGDGKPEIIHGTGTFYGSQGAPSATPSHKVYAWHCDGSAVAGWPITIVGQSSTSPALANLEGGTGLDVVVTDDLDPTPTNPSNFDDEFRVYAFRPNGTAIFSGVKVKDYFGANLSAGNPVVADILGDGGLEILVPTNGSVAVYSSTGTLLSDGGTHPGGSTYAFYNATTLSGVAVGDLESDGVLEVIAIAKGTSNDTVVNAWNPKGGTSAAPPWGMFHQNPARTGVVPGTPACSGPCSTIPPALTKLFTVAPCRLLDTRNANGPQGGPALSANVPRTFQITGFCGIPTTATAVSLNVTVVTPTSTGYVAFGPGTCSPTATSTLFFRTNLNRSNNALLPLSLDGNGQLTGEAFMPSGTTHLIFDVNGYFQ